MMLWIALLAAQAGSGEPPLRHTLGPAYTNVQLESACGTALVRIHFRNESVLEPSGQIISIRIGDEEVQGAAAALQARAAGRFIARIGVMNCGSDEHDPVVMGDMELSPLESQRAGLPPLVFFRIRHEGGVWRMQLE